MQWEFDFLNWLQSLHNPILDTFFSTITHFGDTGIGPILLAVVLLCLPKTRRAGCVVSLALLINYLICNVTLKPMIARIRPYDIQTTIELLTAKEKDFSFPSGHTSICFAAAMALLFFKQKKTGLAMLAISIFIAMSRLYLFMHYPTDVIGGILIGTLSAGLSILFWYWCKREWFRREE